jgi:hypothetical protein
MEGPKKRYPSLSPVATDEAPREPAGRETSVISRKELARELRRQAYQRAKQARATDPRHLAMKEAVKVRRREAYQQVKEKRKAHEAEFKARRKVADAAARVETQRQLAERVRGALHGDAIIPSVISARSARGDASAPAEHQRANGHPVDPNGTDPDAADPDAAGPDAAGLAPAALVGKASKRGRAATRGKASGYDVAHEQDGRTAGNTGWARGDVAREVEEALEDPNIKDLMARLRAESARLAQLAAQQQSPPAGEDGCLPSEGRPETCP